MDERLLQARESIELPYKHITSKSGKNIRSKLFNAFNIWFKLNDKEAIREHEQWIEILQNASLLIDDIEDGTLKRRGLVCAHLIYGIGQTINSGNYFYFKALEKVIKNVDAKKLPEFFQLISDIIDQIMKLHIGQAMDMYWRDNYIVPTEEEYKEMIDYKTGTFFKMIYTPLKHLTGLKIDLDKLCYLIGQYFQIKDDYINLKCDDYTKLKGFAEDISEGKFSLPLIHAIQNSSNDTKILILSILRMRTQDTELKNIVINHLEESKSFEYTKKVLDNLKSEIEKEMKNFDDNQPLQDILSMIYLKE